MLFTSSIFLAFFATFFLLYWLAFKNNLRLQNLLLLFASYVFYCWWDWRFLALLAGSSLVNFLVGKYAYRASSPRLKKVYINIGIIANVGSLLFFKYVNFFIESAVAILSKIGLHADPHTLNILLPLGISFYTFRALNYILDIGKGKLEPTENWVIFFSFIAFFPCLLAGPIDKAKTLIPQLAAKRNFIYTEAVDATRQILWGLFKKSAIADNIAFYTDGIYKTYFASNSSTLLIAAILYPIQIYADFSGYSDIAIGLARLLGFKVTQNFNFPFFAQNIADFWRRWHISLTKWFTEYVFTPLSIHFRDYGKVGLILSVLINLTVIGAWHGANWTFIIFGLLHGLYFIPLVLNGTVNKTKKPGVKNWPSLVEFKNILLTFCLVAFSFIFFRSDSIANAVQFIHRLFTTSLLEKPIRLSYSFTIFIIGMLVLEWKSRTYDYGLAIVKTWPRAAQWAFYYFIIFTVFFFSTTGQNFIYFQF
ncbi:MBOAT family O-acyltransferase [Mucilaginibacter sp. dw_454]|uniref:MBOAT family O-acyltransferase n=1 Tax=Mucilaginibacter sp. dw_454 TaxID=2720079 RepID=UPI001BD30691|nr:MBOAT family O-acyltransferase [Mucilaginibacter sp. dw_454]